MKWGKTYVGGRDASGTVEQIDVSGEAIAQPIELSNSATATRSKVADFGTTAQTRLRVRRLCMHLE